MKTTNQSPEIGPTMRSVSYASFDRPNSGSSGMKEALTSPGSCSRSSTRTSATMAASWPTPMPMPDRRPIRRSDAMVGSIAFAKMIVNSMPTAATTSATATGSSGWPGTANQSEKQPAAQSSVVNTIQGLRGPAASAIAPSSGLNNAMVMPAVACT